MDLPDPASGSVFHVGIDEFAFRRGYQFRTVLVNLESHRVVDLLPDRRVETAAAWMWHHPDIQVVSRDRGGEFAAAATLGAPLDHWLQQVAQSELPELQSFASGVEKDKEAVRAGLSIAINNGMVEGHVTKLKLIKRQGYGRAGIPLLRKHVLHAM